MDSGKTILIIGGGGREHAIAWKLTRARHVPHIVVAPGNGGTQGMSDEAVVENLELSPTAIPALLMWAKVNRPDLTIVGPEAPLALGIVDQFQEAGLPIFGPSQAAARLGSSKVWAKQFMKRYAIPTADFEVFADAGEALAYVAKKDPTQIVIKTSGPASGSGIVLPENAQQARDTVRAMLIDGTFGPAGQSIIIENRVEGREVSLLAFCDGQTAIPMLPTFDHKRAFDGDRGPFTGGMGSYAPTTILSEEHIGLVQRAILQPVIDGMRSEGHPYVGILYAGLFVTEKPTQVKVVKFNCRLGDPETQTLMPLLESDLLPIFEACVAGKLAEQRITWRNLSAVTVVMATSGYPGHVQRGKPISGITTAGSFSNDVMIFHAETRRSGSQILTDGGRVLNVTAVDPVLPNAIDKAYRAIGQIQFDKAYYRTDIGNDVINSWPYASTTSVKRATQPVAAVDAKANLIERIGRAAQRTQSAQVLAGVGAFGGMFRVNAQANPILVASTDGVGTKTILAVEAGQYRGLGHDIVNHCINDILCQGARPLFFMDYIGGSAFNPAVTVELIEGMAEACQDANCALLGGETSELPGIFQSGMLDVAGTVIGIVEPGQLLPTPDIHPGDKLIGIASSGPHTNGYSLIRQAFHDVPLETRFEGIGELGKALLAPHRSYLREVTAMRQRMRIKALAHITGGGFVENIPRVLPNGLGAEIHRNAWEVPALFKLIGERLDLDDATLFHALNMGIGMVMIIAPNQVTSDMVVIGEVVSGRGVRIV